MEVSKIKTGGHINKGCKKTNGNHSSNTNNTRIRTAVNTSVSSKNDGISSYELDSKGNISSGWFGEIDAKNINDSGIEAVNSVVLPTAKKAAGVLAGNLIKYALEKESKKDEKPLTETKPKAVAISNSKLPSKRCRISNKEKFERLYNNKAAFGNRNKSRIKTRHKRELTGKVRKSNTIRTGNRIGLKKYSGKIINSRVSNAHIDKTKTTDSSIEAIQGIRQVKSNINRIAQTGYSGIRTGRVVSRNIIRTAKTVSAGITSIITRTAEGRPKNLANNAGQAAVQMAKVDIDKKNIIKGAFQGNTSFSRLYSTSAKIDKSDITNTGKEVIQVTRKGISTARNTVVGAKRTIQGAKKTYRIGRRIYTKTKTYVRNTAKTTKAIRNAKSMAKKARIAAKAVVKSVKAVINTIKVLFNPVVIKVVAVVIAVLLVYNMISGAVVVVANALNSCFGWLYDSSEPAEPANTTFEKHKSKVLSFIDEVNQNYQNKRDNHSGYEYGFDDAGSELSLRTDIYRDVLAILVVQKQKLYGEHGATDPAGVYDLIEIMKFKDRENKDVINKFYTMSTRSGTHYCGACRCNGHTTYCEEPLCPGHNSTCSGCSCDGHSALYVKIVNHSLESVLTSYSFSQEERERVARISDVLADIESDSD